MSRKKCGIAVAAVFLLLLSVSFACAQEVSEEVAQEETLWLWGEVMNVDNAKGEVVVKYLDYDTDQEKEITVGTDDKTAFENIKSLLDIKPQDTVSIDYVVGPDSKNLAKNVSVEKPEAEGMMQEDVAAEEPLVPEEPSPAAQQ